MRKLWILSITVLVILGCSRSDTDANSKLSEGKTRSEVVLQADPKEKVIAEDKTGGPAGASNIDPAFRDYEYPAADFDGTFSTGDTVSVSYFSQDDLSKVIEFYDQKFPDTAIQMGTTTSFSKENPDGSRLAATISQVGDKAQIILRLDRKR